MINLSKLLSSIKMDLGVYGMALPFDNPDEMLREVIELKTLPTFSTFQPFYSPVKIDLNSTKKIEEGLDYKIYEIPDMFGDRDILFIKKMENDYDGYGGYSNYNGSNLGGLGWGDLMMGQVEANLASVGAPPITFEFISPNKVKIFNVDDMFNSKIRFEVALEHSSNLATIPKSCQYSFTKLATLDIKMMLYNTLKHYNDLQTAFGSINLKIDDWSNAESERQELLREWEETYHMDSTQYIII